jgi:L-threonylcarbamoyladenylate synthase
MPGHPVALSLLRAFAEAQRQAGKSGGGLAAPSANRFGRVSPTRAQHVADELGDTVPLILDGGDCQVGIESTIVDLSRGTPVILRPGAVTAEQLNLVLGEPVATTSCVTSNTPRVSGSLASHYAPRTPLQVTDRARITQTLQKSHSIAAIVREDAGLQSQPNVVVLANNPAAYAHDLYRVLRELDAGGYTQILVQALPDSDAWAAVQDRLGRAAHRDNSDKG